MTREQQRQIKAEKIAAKQQARKEKKVSRMEEKAWNKMVERAKAKGAWIEENNLSN